MEFSNFCHSPQDATRTTWILDFIDGTLGTHTLGPKMPGQQIIDGNVEKRCVCVCVGFQYTNTPFWALY